MGWLKPPEQGFSGFALEAKNLAEFPRFARLPKFLQVTPFPITPLAPDFSVFAWRRAKSYGSSCLKLRSGRMQMALTRLHMAATTTASTVAASRWRPIMVMSALEEFH